ncbi:MAG: GumC family protein [Hyphomicrobiaceae bacterium]
MHRHVDRSSTDLGGFFTIIGRRLASILLATLLATLLAIAYLALAKPSYTASTSLFIDPRTRKVVADDTVPGNLASDQLLVESQVAIIGSDGVLRRVVRSMRLDQDEEFVPPPGQGLLSKVKALFVTPRQPADAETRAVLELSERLKVKRAQKTYVVEVETSSTSPVKAARLSEAVVAAYLEDQSGAKSEEARRANQLIDARLGELRAELRRAETKVDDFRKANKILVSEGGLVMEQQVTRLNSELATARAVAAESKARLDQVNAALAGGGSPEFLPDAIRSSLIQRLREQHAQVARREAALSSQLQGRHPVLIEVRSQVEEIRNQINAELKRISTSAKSDNQIAMSRVDELQKSLDKAKDEVAKANTAQIRLRELEQEVATSRELLNTFLTRAKETQEQQNLSLAEARVISPASVPTKPSKPLSWLVLALGVLGGLGIGVARALVADHMDRSVRSSSEVETQTGLTAIASLPTLGTTLLARMIGKAPRGEPTGFSDIMSAISEPHQTGGGIVYRQAVLRLLTRFRAASGDHRPAIAMLVSANSGAGTSSTALAVAYAASLSGDRVLLVDAASADSGLSNVLAADFQHDGVIALDNKAHLQSIMRRDQRSGLAFLPIALADLRSLKSQQRKRFATGLTALASGYDLMVIDGGALLEDESATALLGIVDQIVVVARSGVTQSAALAEVSAMLAPVRDRVLGTVLNMTANDAA